MQRNTQGAMDFEYENKTGPIDEQSRFIQETKRQQQARPGQTDNIAKKRPWSEYDSPGKPSPFASLPNPASSRPYRFGSQTLDNPAWLTPRISREAEIPSSGPETSPEPNVDSEANTPDMGVLGIPASVKRTGGALKSIFTTQKLDSEDCTSPLSVKRFKGTPGRGELVKDAYSNKVLKRVQHRRKDNDRRHALRRTSSPSDSENGASPQRSGSQGAPPREPGKLASLFTFIEHHPNLPHILSFYAQLALNIFLVLAIIYGIYTFWSTIRADVDKKAEEAELDVLAAISACAHEFRENGCAADRRVPALEAPCANWRRCMERDAKGVSRARVSAHTFAEIFNSFIEPISIKAMVFTLIICLSSFGISNLAFGLFRSKTHPQAYAPAPQPPAYSMPPTPHRWPNGDGIGWDGGDGQNWGQVQTPSQWRQGSPTRSPRKGLEGMEGATPSRRLDYR